MKLFLSCPVGNEPCSVIKKFIVSEAESAFSEVDQPDPNEEYSKRVERIKDSDACLFCLDTLLPEGQGLFYLSGVVRGEMQIPIPPDMINLIGIGLQATGKAKLVPKKGLILPGQQSGMEIANLPTSFTIRNQDMVVGLTEGGISVNLTEPYVMFEYGVATAHEIPTVLLAMARPRIGPVADLADLVYYNLKDTKAVLEEFVKAIKSSMMGDFRKKGVRLKDKLSQYQSSLNKKREEEDEKYKK